MEQITRDSNAELGGRRRKHSVVFLHGTQGGVTLLVSSTCVCDPNVTTEMPHLCLRETEASEKSRRMTAW